jgi:iron complex outermembrane receptor protein
MIKGGKVAAAVTAAIAIAATTCLSTGSAWAQDQNGQGAAAGGAQNADQGAGALQEVVVTAERRATDVQSTPIAVTAISGNQLQELHLNNISDLQTTVPSFQVMDESGYFNDMNIRGMGQTTNQPIVNPGVAVFRDGLLMAEPISQSEPMFDIHDTEVLEGPQGTFIGGSATAGAVLITSNDPDFRGFSGFLDSQLGDFSDTKITGAANLPVSDTFAARLAFNTEQRHSYYRDIGAIQTSGPSSPIIDPGHADNRQLRLSLLWRPTTNFQALGKAEYSYIQTGGEPAEPNPETYTTLFGSVGNAGCTITGSVIGGCAPGTVQHSQYWYPGEKPFVLEYYGTQMQEDERFDHFSVELRYTLPDGIVLRSLTGHVHIDINHQTNQSYGPENAGTFFHEIGPNDNYYSEELNVISPATGKLTWIAGGFWMYRDTPVFVHSYTVNPVAVGTPDTINGYYAAPEPYNLVAVVGSESVERIMGLFGQVQWQMTDHLQWQLGARENWDNNFSFNNPQACTQVGATLDDPFQCGTGVYSINYAGGQVASYTQRAISNAGGHYSDSVPTGKLNLSWVPVAGQNFYIFYAQGYKAGGVNNTSTDHHYFDPEHIHDYEAGWKGRLFGGRMATQVGLYYIAYDGLQYNIFDPVENGDTGTGEVVENLGPSKIKGIEISEQAKFGHFGVNLGFDYNDSSLGAIRAVPDTFLPPGFNSGLGHPQCIAGNTYSAGQTCFDYTPYEVNVGGEETPYGPKVTANISVDYAFPVGNGSVLDPRLTFSHTDRQYASIFQNPYTEMGERNLLDGTLDFTHGAWLLQLYGKNLTNQTYIVGDTVTNVFYGAPRIVGIRANYTWGS